MATELLPKSGFKSLPLPPGEGWGEGELPKTNAPSPCPLPEGEGGNLLRRADGWVWPLTAAIVMGGSILFWSLAGLFWLAARPSQPPIVIRMGPPAAHADAGHAFDHGNGQHAGPIVAETNR